jgi:hypothetical protein
MKGAKGFISFVVIVSILQLVILTVNYLQKAQEVILAPNVVIPAVS